MKTEVITCIQCEKPFNFSESERQFFESKGFDIPKRCPDCRKKKNKIGKSDGDVHKKKDKKRDTDRNTW